jgi:hypothetical protein
MKELEVKATMNLQAVSNKTYQFDDKLPVLPRLPHG